MMAWQTAASTASSAVRSIKAFRLREPDSRRAYTMLRLDTSGGLTGWGECAASVSDADTAAAVRALQGVDTSAYEVAWLKLAAFPTFRAAVDMALIDVSAQQSKAPAYQLLGGPTRNKCRAYTMLEGAAGLERALNAGFKAVGVSAPVNEWRNAGKAYVEKTANLMQMMRRAAGDGVDFVLDGAGRMVPGDAQSVAEVLERFHLLFFDEPVPISNLGAVRKIAGENVTPLGLGRGVDGPGGFMDLLREDCVDLLRPNLAQHGLSQIRRIAAVAETYYVAVAPYHDGGPLGTAAALHLAASLPNFFIQQIPSPTSERDRAFRRGLLSIDVEAVSSGFAALPNGAGWGVQVNQSAVEKAAQEAGV